MPHITFIHGISNKPEKRILLDNWVGYLNEGGFDIVEHSCTASMVYWANVMYEVPEVPHEKSSRELAQPPVTEDEWSKKLPDIQRNFVQRLEHRLLNNTDDEKSSDEDGPRAFPLPEFVVKRIMKRFLRDVHHYLYNAESNPRPGETFAVQTYIRELFVNQLVEDAAKSNGPHIVVSHSMGTVIAYDCLKNVPGCPAIDGLMTVGSPLGISEIQDAFEPEYAEINAFPEIMAPSWKNIFDSLDPVNLDKSLRSDYLKHGEKIIEDIQVKNEGPWHHSASKYFSQRTLCDELREMIG